MKLRKRNKLVFGFGINDADYNVYKMEGGAGYQRVVWRCPFYARWHGMLGRCYDSKRRKKAKSYEGCSVIKEWLRFSIFKAWMETQDWEGKQLDKDILVQGNRVYGPDTCVFVDVKTNNFFLERTAARGEYPIGVSLYKRTGLYRASASSPDGSIILGNFDNPEDAHDAWLSYKLEQARKLAKEQADPRVADAIIDRYENYQLHK